MKKILLIVALISAFAACSKNEIFEEASNRVGFDTYALRTKAGDTYVGGNQTSTSNIPAGGKFGVFAYFHPAVGNTAGSWDNSNVNNNRSNLMLNQSVERVEPSSGTYAYYYPATESRYWPKNNNDRISFFAYYPYASNAFIVDENATSDGTGITLQDPDDDHYGYAHNPVGFPKFKFTVNPDASEQVDFMISDMCLNQSKAAGVLTGSGNVKFTFHHMLSQIRIKTVDVVIDNEDVDVEVESFKFIGVPVSGIVTPSVSAVPSPIGTGHAEMEFAWSDYNSRNSEFTTTIYDDNGTAAEKQAAIMLMIPHRFSDDPDKDIVEVTFKVTRALNGAGEHYEYTGHLRTSLGAGGLEGWERNKIYNYTISVTLNDIRLSANVEDWPEASTDVNTLRVDLENIGN